MTPLTFEDYARSVITDRLAEIRRDHLAAQARRAIRPHTSARPFASTARVRLADGLRSVARRLDPTVVAEPRLVIARSR
jgi:hypothetical protein